MLLTPEQMQAIQAIIEKYHSAFVVNTISPQAVPPEVLAELKKLGLVDPKIESIKDAYLYGQLIGILQNPTVAKMGYKEFQKYLKQNPVPLTAVEQQALKFAQLHAGQYARGLGNRMSIEAGEYVAQHDQAFRSKMRQTIKDKVSEAIERRKTVKELTSDLGWASQNWERDWERISVTEKHTAMQRGLGDYYRKKYGEDALVAKRVMPDACKWCLKLHLDSEGHPRIYKLSTLEANGTNVGRKAADWKAVIGTVHPNCQCVLVYIPEGWGFDENDDLVPGGEFGKRYESESDLELAMLEEQDLQKAFALQDEITFQGIPIAIENRKGTKRYWKDAEGNRGETTLTYAYGYFKRTQGADQDEIDCFVGPDPRAPYAFIVQQQNPNTGQYDEEKVMLGFASQEVAEQAYKENYDSADDFFITATPLDVDALKRYLALTKPAKGEMAKGLTSEFGSNATQVGNRAPGPGLGVNFVIPQAFGRLDYEQRRAQQRYEPKDFLAENKVHRGDPLKKEKADYEIQEPAPRTVHTIEVPDTWKDSAEHARAGADERKLQHLENWIRQQTPANKPSIEEDEEEEKLEDAENIVALSNWRKKSNEK